MTIATPPPAAARPRTVRAPRGTEISCRGWQQEAALRMLMNNLDPEVAERPEELVVYGGSGKAARNWECFEAIVATLKRLGDDETLLVQSGKPVAVFKTHAEAPAGADRQLDAGAALGDGGRVPPPGGARPHHVRPDDGRLVDLHRHPGHPPGHLRDPRRVRPPALRRLARRPAHRHRRARRHGRRPAARRDHERGGLPGRRGRPLAASSAGSPPATSTRWRRTSRRAVERALAARDRREAISIAVEANAVDLLEHLVATGHRARRADRPDLRPRRARRATCRTASRSPRRSRLRRRPIPRPTSTAPWPRWRPTCAPCSRSRSAGRSPSTTATTCAARRWRRARRDAFDIGGFVPLFIRPLFCEGKGPFRWAVLSGDPEDLAVTDEAILATFPEDEALARWIRLARERVAFQGLPARICWLGYGERAKAGKVFNELVASGKVKAPIVIGRDHLDCGSVASPNRETEGMRDGSDAIGDWPILNALLNAVNGATWVSVHHGGGVGIGYSLHAGMVIVADGTEAAARRLERVLTGDPGMGVVRHADAGYPEAIACARGARRGPADASQDVRRSRRTRPRAGAAGGRRDPPGRRPGGGPAAAARLGRPGPADPLPRLAVAAPARASGGSPVRSSPWRSLALIAGLGGRAPRAPGAGGAHPRDAAGVRASSGRTCGPRPRAAAAVLGKSPAETPQARLEAFSRLSRIEIGRGEGAAGPAAARSGRRAGRLGGGGAAPRAAGEAAALRTLLPGELQRRDPPRPPAARRRPPPVAGGRRRQLPHGYPAVPRIARRPAGRWSTTRSRRCPAPTSVTLRGAPVLVVERRRPPRRPPAGRWRTAWPGRPSASPSSRSRCCACCASCCPAADRCSPDDGRRAWSAPWRWAA